jgi:hypothetical protein
LFQTNIRGGIHDPYAAAFSCPESGQKKVAGFEAAALESIASETVRR